VVCILFCRLVNHSLTLTLAYWCIPLTDQVSIVATILIPLARRATQRRASPNANTAPSSSPNPFTREMLVSVISTASTYWPDTISVPIFYAHDPAFYGDEAAAGGSKYQEFSRKVDGLVLQFCGSSPTELAIAIVQAAIFGKTHYSIGRDRERFLTYIQPDLSPTLTCRYLKKPCIRIQFSNSEYCFYLICEIFHPRAF
jgi:hypothetical protein